MVTVKQVLVSVENVTVRQGSIQCPRGCVGVWLRGPLCIHTSGMERYLSIWRRELAAATGSMLRVVALTRSWTRLYPLLSLRCLSTLPTGSTLRQSCREAILGGERGTMLISLLIYLLDLIFNHVLCLSHLCRACEVVHMQSQVPRRTYMHALQLQVYFYTTRT